MAELRDTSIKIHNSINTVKKELDGFSFDDRLETYPKWAREVERFSFRWHLRGERDQIPEDEPNTMT